MTSMVGPSAAILLAMLVATLPVPTYSQANCPDLSVALDEIKARYGPEFDRLQAEGSALLNQYGDPSEAETSANLDSEIDWVTHTIVVSFPTLTLRDQTATYEIPRLVTRSVETVFDAPVVRTHRIKCGEVPEISGFTITMREIYCDVPEVSIESQRIVTEMPELVLEQQEIDLQVPELEVIERSWTVRIPEIAAVEVSEEQTEARERAVALKESSDAVAEAMRRELTTAVTAGFDCRESILATSRANLIAQMDLTIQQVSSSTQEIAQSEARSGDAQVALEERLKILRAEKDRQVARIDQAIETLHVKEQEALRGLLEVSP